MVKKKIYFVAINWTTKEGARINSYLYLEPSDRVVEED